MASDGTKREPKMPCGHENGRNLVVCIDGTSNQFGVKNTNVIELYNLILKEEANQRTWYNSGIGTYARPSWKSLKHYKKVLYHKIDLGIAWGFERTILAAYRWLSDNYEKGDCIFLFGFSRGAYQVRVLSAMIEKVGLIHKGNEAQIPFAYEMYADSKSGKASVTLEVGQVESREASMAQRFKNAFSHKAVRVHFIGAWDTVSSIGIMRGKKMLPGTVDGMTHVCYFRQALALDERRVKFLPEYAYGGTSISRKKDDDDTNMHKKDVVKDKHPEAKGSRLQVVKRLIEERPQIMEVWFAGTHSDIGGGNTENIGMDRRKPPLRWIVFEAKAAGLRVDRLDRGFLSEQKIEFRESLKWYWWTLEVLPFKRLTFTRREDGLHQITYKPHLGSSRKIQPGQKIHSSLLLTDEMSTSYTPKARPLDDHPLFWEVLREEGFHSKWLEIDLYEAIQRLIEDFIVVGDGSAKHHLNKIATSGDGLQALYEDMLYVLGTKEAKVQHQLLTFLNKLLEGREAQIELKSSVEVRSLLSKLWTGDEEKYQKTARDFLKSFSDRNRWELDLDKSAEIELELFIARDSKAQSILGKLAEAHDGQQAIYEQVIKVLDTSDVEAQHQLLQLSISLFKGNSEYYAQLKLRPWVEVRSSVSSLLESGQQGCQKTVLEFLVYFTEWSKWVGDDLDEVIQEVIGNLIAGYRGMSLSVLRKLATSGRGQAIYDKMVKELNAKYQVQKKLLSAMLTIFESNSQDAQLRLKRSVDVGSVLLERWKTRRGYQSPAREFLRELTDPCIDVFHQETSQILSVAFSFDDEYVALCLKDGTIRLWHATTKVETVEKPFQMQRVALESVAISFDRRFIALRLDDGTIRIWNAEKKEMVGRPLQASRNTAKSVAVSSDGGSIALGLDDGTIQFWDARTWSPVAEGHETAVNSVAFSPDGKHIASGSHDGRIRIWDAETAHPVEGPLKGHEAAVNSIAFSPDGKYISSGSHDGGIRIWTVRRHETAVNSVAFSPDGKYIASGSHDGRIRIWDAGTAHPVGGPLKGHEAAVNSVAFSPDGKYMVSGSEDKTVRIWDVQMGESIGRPLQGHTASIQFVSFSDDGKRIVSGAWDMNDMAARTWDAETVMDVGGSRRLRSPDGANTWFSNIKKYISHLYI